jgi:DNA-binding transcriptional LysR family regulator
VLLAADAADLALKAEAREPAGQLTITAPVLFGHMYVAPAIVRFMQRHEKVRCSVRLYDRR